MKKWLFIFLLPALAFAIKEKDDPQSWIRINQLGYTPGGVKVAIWCSKEETGITNWQLIDASTKHIAISEQAGTGCGV